MRDYAKISPTIWRSRKFKALGDNDDARLFYLYLHTCPHGNSVGCFWLPKGYINADMGWSDTHIDTCIKDLCERVLIRWDEGENVVQIVDFLEHSPIYNDKHAAGSVKLALALPDCDVKSHIIKELQYNARCASIPELKEYKTPNDTPIETGILTETDTDTEEEPSPSSLRSDAPHEDSRVEENDTAEDDGQEEPNPGDVLTLPHCTNRTGDPALEEKPKKRKSQLPEDWTLPDADRAWAEAKAVMEEVFLDIDREAEKFKNYHHGKGSKQLDWAATWRTWVINGCGYARERGDVVESGGAGGDILAERREAAGMGEY